MGKKFWKIWIASSMNGKVRVKTDGPEVRGSGGWRGQAGKQFVMWINWAHSTRACEGLDVRVFQNNAVWRAGGERRGCDIEKYEILSFLFRMFYASRSHFFNFFFSKGLLIYDSRNRNLSNQLRLERWKTIRLDGRNGKIWTLNVPILRTNDVCEKIKKNCYVGYLMSHAQWSRIYKIYPDGWEKPWIVREINI